VLYVDELLCGHLNYRQGIPDVVIEVSHLTPATEYALLPESR
jgi:hypothetical protein